MTVCQALNPDCKQPGSLQGDCATFVVLNNHFLHGHAISGSQDTVFHLLQVASWPGIMAMVIMHLRRKRSGMMPVKM